MSGIRAGVFGVCGLCPATVSAGPRLILEHSLGLTQSCEDEKRDATVNETVTLNDHSRDVRFP